MNQKRKADAIYSESHAGCWENNKLGYSLPITLYWVLFYSTFGLARIFHTDLLRRPGKQMDAALDSHCDLSNTSARLALSGLPKGSLPRGLLGRRWYPIRLRSLLVTISMKYPG